MSEPFVRIPPEYFTAPGSGIDLALLRRPRGAAATRRRAFSLPPTSSIRQRMLGRILTLAFETYERGDYTTVPNLLYAPDCHLHAADSLRMDLPKLAVGRQEIVKWLATWHEPFTSVKWRPLELLDGGDVGYFAIEMSAFGRASGAAVGDTMHSAFRITDNFISWQLTTGEREEALGAAGFA